MSNPIENERIDGVLHAAVPSGHPTGKYWDILRATDGVSVASVGPFEDNEISTCQEEVKRRLAKEDARARHWIEHTQAPNQELREAAGPLVNDINERLENCFTLWEWRDDAGVSHYCFSEEAPYEYIPGAPAGGHGDPPPDWMIPDRRSPSPLHAILKATYCEGDPPSALAAALSNNPQVSEGSEAADKDEAFRLYLLLALFDRRDGTYTANLVQTAREGYERSGMDEDDAWREFDALWDSSDSSDRLDAVRQDYPAAWSEQSERGDNG